LDNLEVENLLLLIWLPDFYDITEGEIKIDGINIKDMSQSSLRGLMGLVTQDSILFNDTIKENLKIGKPNATDEELIDSLKIANAYEFVKELPKRYGYQYWR